MARREAEATLAILVAVHRDEFIAECEGRGMTTEEARDCLEQFEREHLNEEAA